MISTAPSGSPIAGEIPNFTVNLKEVPQSSADFRPDGPVPETLADILPLANEGARKRWKKAFDLIVDWKGSDVPLRELFMRTNMNGFRPFLKTCGGKLGYLENTIVAYRKGLTYLRDLAASRGVQVEPVYKEPWREIMALAEANYCLAMAEPLEAAFASPSDVSLDDVEDLVDEMVKTRQKRLAGARKVKFVFLTVMLKCGFDLHPVNSARVEDYITPIPDLPQPLRSQVERLDTWMREGDKTEARWSKGWRNQETKIQKKVRARRAKTTDKTIADICRTFGYLKKYDPDGVEGVESLETLFQLGIMCACADWLEDVRHLNPGSIRNMFGGMFAALRYFPHAKVDLSWSTDFMAALPEYSRVDRNARKLPRMLPLGTLDKVPDLLCEELAKLQARHNKAEMAKSTRRRHKTPGVETSTDKKLEKARVTRLTRIATVALQDLVIDWLITLAWRNENLIGLRLEEVVEQGKIKPANLLHIRACEVAGADQDDWLDELQKNAPQTKVWMVDFPAEETKAGRPVRAILPRPLSKKLDKFMEEDSYRDMLLGGNKSAYLLVNQWGNRMSAQQLEEAVEEATAIYAGRAVNPHLFRDIIALAFLKEPKHNGDFLTLSKILWHKNHMVTIMEYAWMYDESVGVNIAAKWSEERRSGRKQLEAALSHAQRPQNWMGAVTGWSAARRGGNR